MRAIQALIVVAILSAIAIFAAGVPGLHLVLGVILPYLALAIFVPEYTDRIDTGKEPRLPAGEITLGSSFGFPLEFLDHPAAASPFLHGAGAATGGFS